MQWHRGRRRTFRGSSLSPLAAGIRSRYGFKCVTPARGSVAILGSPWKSVNLSSHRDAEQQHFGIGVGDLDRAPGLGRERGGEIRRGRARRIARVVERAGKREIGRGNV